MQFSQRTYWELDEDFFAGRVRAARKAGSALLDLTVSNPTTCGFAYDGRALLAPLSDAATLHYDPQPFGMVSARASIAQYYADAGACVPLDRICLTTSTSEAYSFLFRLLCDEGDEVLIATPSYPLFDFIARLDGVALRTYPVVYDHGWQMDMAALENAITARTRAVIVVHPNNPTGHFCSRAEREALDALCAERNLALIVDEVFLDYALPGRDAQSFLCAESRALTFVLSGISKLCGLPQMKCSWLAAAGPRTLVEAAIARLEVIADTFLSMNAPVQHALPLWLAARHGFQGQVRARCAANVAAGDALLAGFACERLQMDAGWSAVLRVPRVDFAERALAAGVIVQPGGYYGMDDGRVVVSLLTPEDVWNEGMRRLAAID